MPRNTAHVSPVLPWTTLLTGLSKRLQYCTSPDAVCRTNPVAGGETMPRTKGLAAPKKRKKHVKLDTSTSPPTTAIAPVPAEPGTPPKKPTPPYSAPPDSPGDCAAHLPFPCVRLAAAWRRADDGRHRHDRGRPRGRLCSGVRLGSRRLGALLAAAAAAAGRCSAEKNVHLQQCVDPSLEPQRRRSQDSGADQ